MFVIFLLLANIAAASGNSADDKDYPQPSVNESNADEDWDSSTLIFASVVRTKYIL